MATSIIALLLAIPATVILGPFAFIAAASFGGYPFESPGTIFMSLLGIGGLFGICGLWLRVFIRTSEEKSLSLSDIVTLLLLAGSVTCLALVASIAYIEGATESMDIPLQFAFLGLGVIGLAMTVQNFLSNQKLRRGAQNCVV